MMKIFIVLNEKGHVKRMRIRENIDSAIGESGRGEGEKRHFFLSFF